MNFYPELEDKLMSLGDAVGRFIKNGLQIAVGDFTATRNPMADYTDNEMLVLAAGPATRHPSPQE